MSIDYDSEFKAIICHRNSIINAFGSMLFGMNMYNRGLQYNYVFKSLNSNSQKRYNQSDLYALHGLAMMRQKNGNDSYNDALDKEYICLVMHAKLYMSVYNAVTMSREAQAGGKTYIFEFNIEGKGRKTYTGANIIALNDEAEGMKSCCDIDEDCITRCVEYFEN